MFLSVIIKIGELFVRISQKTA